MVFFTRYSDSFFLFFLSDNFFIHNVYLTKAAFIVEKKRNNFFKHGLYFRKRVENFDYINILDLLRQTADGGMNGLPVFFGSLYAARNESKITERIAAVWQHRKMSDYRFVKIDTASIMFSSLSTKNWGRTFRFAAILKDEVDPGLLKKAAEDLKPFFPCMYSNLKRGFFWNYQKLTDELPEIRQEFSRPLLPITRRNDAKPDFRLVYFQNRLAIECSHSLGDGKGVMIYFKRLLERYIDLKNGKTEGFVTSVTPEERSANAFSDYFEKGGEKAKDTLKKAYHFPEKYEDGYLKLLFAMMPVEEIKDRAHLHSMTVTEYLSCVLILGVIRAAKEPIKEPVTIAVPVNLRRFFETHSARNFTVQTHITFEPDGRQDITLDEICEKTRNQLRSQLKREELQKTLNKFGSLAANPVLKIVPNVIKLPALRMIQKNTHNKFTTIFTNYGDCVLDETVSNRIERLEFINGDTRNYGLAVTCSCISYNGILSLCFSMANRDTSFAAACIRILTEIGTDVRVECTDGNGEEKDEM